MPERQPPVRSDIGLWPPTWPMGLTMLRLFLLPVFLWLILADAQPGPRTHRLWAIFVFAIMAATDKLDGYLARKLNQLSKLGAVLDPVADKLLVACSVILLSFDWIAGPAYRIPFAVVAVLYGGYLFVAIGTLTVLALAGKVAIAARPVGKLGTVVQLALVILTLFGPLVQPGGKGAVHATIVVLWWVVPILAILTCLDYAIQGFKQVWGTPQAQGT